MSFSGNVKGRIVTARLLQARHCQIAELAALISMCGAVVITPGDERSRIKIHTEKIAVARKCFTLVDKNI